MFVVVVLAMAAACADQPADEGRLVQDLGSLMQPVPQAPAIAEVAPEHVEIVFADPLVQASVVTLGPGESIPEHDASHRVLLAVNGGGTLQVERDGQLLSEAFRDGEVRYLQPGTASFENLGELPLELVAVTRTGVALPEFMERDGDQAASPGRILLDNEAVRVRELALSPEETAELPAVPIRAVYALGALSLEYRTAAGEQEHVQTESAQAYSRAGNDEWVANRGEEDARFLVVEWLI